MWDDGWSISIVSSYDTVTRTISDALLDAKAIRGQGVLATRNNVAWGMHITGRPVELTDGRITNGLDASGSVKKAVLWSLISNPPNFFDKSTDTTDNIIDSGLNNRFVTSNEKRGAARGFLGLNSSGMVNINVPLARLALAVGIRSSDGKLDLGKIGNGNIDNILDGASYKKVGVSYVDASHRPIVSNLAQIADGLLSKYATAAVTSQSVPGEVGGYYAVVQTGHQTMKGGACLVIAVLRQKFTDSDTFQVGIQRNIYNGLSTRIYTGENSTSVERIRAAICVDTSPGTGQNDYVMWVKYNSTDGSCTFAEASISIINIGK